MAGYSGTPLAKKLGIKEGHRVALVHAPEDFEQTLGALPADVTLQRHQRGKSPFDVIVFFATEAAMLRKQFASLAERLTTAGGLWVAWPKKAARIDSDLTDNIVRVIGLDAGLVDNKVCAVDETWSGLRFVFRLKDRPVRVTKS